ncbi:MAG: maleylpyruvate isomerase family mycothiol-dependent enzyme [Frankia sp.]|nr:maleylpyruvate isomerase family mycothiol-dependent enzyme [Frankia sp.]
MLPGEAALLEERRQFLQTIESLSDEEFERGTTLCAEWAPRDVLAHLLGEEERSVAYLTNLLRISAANDKIVAEYRAKTRQDLTQRARAWASRVTWSHRFFAVGLLGDVATHHQDVLRGVGRTREIPEASKNAILREGVILGGTKLLRHHVVPTDGGRALGRGREVRGTREALGLWLAGRQGLEPELEGL